ncbi:MAG: hypothetical protein ABMB14_28240 [Myxococcota bacterium]
MTGWWIAALAAAATSSPAPTHDWHGLALGATDATGIDGWATAHGWTCATAPSPRRTTVHHDCDHPDPSAIGEQALRGRLDQVLLARLDDGPLHHVSTDRVFAVPADASATYAAALARLTATFGPPVRTMAAPATFDGPLIRATTTWTFSDLTVDLTVMRVGTGPIHLSERWDVPGVEARAITRPGTAAIHGGGTPTPAKNPHLAD